MAEEAKKKEPIRQRAFCRGCKKMTLQTKEHSGVIAWTCEDCKDDAAKDKLNN